MFNFIMKDKFGYPIETVKGKWFGNCIRVIFQNIRKLGGPPTQIRREPSKDEYPDELLDAMKVLESELTTYSSVDMISE